MWDEGRGSKDGWYQYRLEGIWILDFGSWTLDLGIWDLGCGTRVEGRGTVDTSIDLKGFGSWTLDLGIWDLRLGTWNLGLGTWNLGLETWDLEFGNYFMIISLMLISPSRSDEKMRITTTMTQRTKLVPQETAHFDAI